VPPTTASGWPTRSPASVGRLTRGVQRLRIGRRLPGGNGKVTVPLPSGLIVSQVLACWTRRGVARWMGEPAGALPRADEWLPRWGGRLEARRAPGTVSPARAAIRQPRATPWAKAPHERGQNRPCPAMKNLGKDKPIRESGPGTAAQRDNSIPPRTSLLLRRAPDSAAINRRKRQARRSQ
jgi:hypothetical protein